MDNNRYFTYYYRIHRRTYTYISGVDVWCPGSYIISKLLSPRQKAFKLDKR